MFGRAQCTVAGWEKAARTSCAVITYRPKSIFRMPLVLIPVAGLKEISIELFRDMMPNLESLIKRMAIVKSGVDACPVSFVLQLADILVGMSCLRRGAARSKFHMTRTEEILNGLGYCAGGAAMSRGEFRMRGSWREWQPCWIDYGVGISVDISLCRRNQHSDCFQNRGSTPNGACAIPSPSDGRTPMPGGR